jgi:carotenoid cleavage dioxygenase-like enzyme
MGYDNRAPITEERPLTPVEVTGRLPAGLRGTLFRNGPNPLKPAPGAHWFMGDGMIHAFRIGDTGVQYGNRWVRTAARANSAGENGTGLPEGLANTNVVAHARALLALEEQHLPVAIDPVSLATMGATNFSGGLPAGPFTAHPKHDPQTGDLLFFGYGAEGVFKEAIRIGIVDAAGRVIRCETVTAPYAAMVHDFAVTERFVAIPLFPLIADPSAGLVWRQDRGSYLGVMDRKLGAATLRWVRAPDGFAFHVMNAWDEDGMLSIDMMLSAAPPFFAGPSGEISVDAPCCLTRWSLDTHHPAALVTSRQLSGLDGEFPRIDERFAGRRHQHGFFTLGEAICHRNEVTGRETMFRLSAGDSVSEPVFVARGAGEADGWLLAVLFRQESLSSELAIFEAMDVASGPVARALLPCRVPAGFHGNWLDAHDVLAPGEAS